MVSAPAANQGEGDIEKESEAPLDYDEMVRVIVQEALAQYPSAEDLAQALAEKEGIFGYGARAGERRKPYSKQVVVKWSRKLKAGGSPVPGSVLMAICHLTSQSLDTPLGMAEYLEVELERLLADAKELQLAMGRLHRSRNRAPAIKPRGRGA